MGSVGAPEIMVILLVGLILLGPTRLPEVARQAAKMLAEFKRMTQNVQAELRAEMKDITATPGAALTPPPQNGSSAGVEPSNGASAESAKTLPNQPES